MHFDINDIVHYITSYLWPFCRLSGLIVALPVIGSRMLPKHIKIILASLLTVIIVPMIPASPNIDPISFVGLMVVVQQFLIGLSMGFIFQLVFQTFVVGGQIIAMQSGLGFAAMVDPGSGSSVPLVSQLYLILVSLLFINLNGHLAVMQTLINSFTQLPIGAHGLDTNSFWHVADFASKMFQGAVMVALPAIVSLLLVNMSFGVMSRAAPQLNIFAIGFPMTLTFGIIIIYLTLFIITPHFQTMLGQGFNLTQLVLVRT